MIIQCMDWLRITITIVTHYHGLQSSVPLVKYICGEKFLETSQDIIDACMHLHDFIAYFCWNENFTLLADRVVFEEDCRQFFTIQTELDNEGIHGGKKDLCRDHNINVLCEGCPPQSEALSTGCGMLLRNFKCDKIAQQRLIWPKSNCYCQNKKLNER
jgi:hypothetical protein